MTYKWLKWTRVTVALVFFLLTTLVFLDFKEVVGEKGVNNILFLQFVPSLLKFFAVFSLSAAGFIIILVLTALFGRVYCSAICPLGILQDFISRAGKLFRKKRKRRYKYLKPRNILRYTILAATVILGIFASVFVVNLLDPYSLFGKVATGLFRPVGIWINNGLASILESMNVYVLYLRDISMFHLAAFIFPVIILVVLLYMSGRYGRLYCNTICPVGTLLGWLSKYSLFRIELDKDQCIKCGKCAFSCKSGCISI
ncbi:MAG TPA: 4Fe-4S binding protein, partial [Bacteroidales bacterium]|nr:4Fe-4S binding protein [Bacteroidales bacterium]